jgi:dTDP-4-amino-4,6-dideoxygalactose transaminase
MKKIPFYSLSATNDVIRKEVMLCFEKVFNSNWYILGNELVQFEKEYATFNNVNNCIGVANGLDALILSLKALNIKNGDEVIVPSNTYIATWLAVSYVGAVPIPVEPSLSTYNIEASEIEKLITSKTKAIIPVHLYGQACQMDLIISLSKKYNLYIVEDNAQAQGAMYNNQLTGSFGILNATSFYPGKNLGALGDGGAITTNDDSLAEQIRILRNYGSNKKYYNQIKGLNSRLDELQASFLKIKLQHLNNWNAERNILAKRYLENLDDCKDLVLPMLATHCTSNYHLFVIRSTYRDKLQAFLHQLGIETIIHYPIPPHLQNAYKELDYKSGSLPIAENLANTSLSLPLYPGLNILIVDFISDAIIKFYKNI